MRVRRTVVAATALVAVLGGCSEPSSEPTDTAWEEPAWFAEQDREREEARSALQGCMDGRGWAVPMTEDGGTTTGFTDETEANRFMEDSRACLAESGLESEVALSTDEIEELYDRQLETLECLRREGVELPDAPTRETYVEQTSRFLGGDESATWWEPYADLYTMEENRTIDAAASAAAQAACPQYWVR
ncbi:hypothetical protein [Cellulomonas fimi]|uniref:Lipoprotein n=1 Tax=Cellulomonas fimi (strain ATCC 484 / DSM 20113 / JCM 1341 / CCUG 24087 / LMG 16345 / NBRC 15513 / NCIMB 8980 / NCTC 7547 / NRS-133) TaxID=590998 RepID=F4H4Q1_CELFA|nr:hypothetical protein [Cellulomonas fimi]AEE44252.1 hypothetical protein Celf_0102 [Cellulomonas fimi ATCC 484]NNH05699.1 hypothetical protein [Cellulomonas fimi]VEH25974.1 Uncharacterised protein [Cellulomonas fimi]